MSSLTRVITLKVRQLEFTESPAVNNTITLTSYDGTAKTYITKADGTVTDGTLDVDGNVQFNNGSGKTPNERANSAAKIYKLLFIHPMLTITIPADH